MIAHGNSSARVVGAIAVLLVATAGTLDAQAMAKPGVVGAPILIDSFDDVSAWRAVPSDGVSLTISRDAGLHGSAMRLDFDFHGGAGYAVAHRAVNLDLPVNYELSFMIHGDAPRNNVEVKLLDASGENVWWVNRKDYVFPKQWTRFTVKKRQISFAWGPLGGGELHRVAAIEISITAGSGGKGTVWIDDLTLTPLAPVPAIPIAPIASASSSERAHPPSYAVDGRRATEWHSGTDARAYLTLDLGYDREFGGLTIDWDSLDYARDYDVDTSSTGEGWGTAYQMRNVRGGREYLYMPESESRMIRLSLRRSSCGRGFGIREVTVEPLAWSASLNAFYFAVARDAPRGMYPRAFSDSVQTYWTVIGAPAADREALVSEDGAVEVDKGAFSLEPFLFARGKLLSWADFTATQSLDSGYLPIPSVKWTPRSRGWTPRSRGVPISLTTTAWVAGPADSAILMIRYRVTNHGSDSNRATLFVAIRPFQVNGPWQFLNTPGGAARVRWISRDATGVVHVDAPIAPEIRSGGPPRPPDGIPTQPRSTGIPPYPAVPAARIPSQPVIPIPPADAFGATTFDAGSAIRWLTRDSVPPTETASDSTGRVSGALAYHLDIPARSTRDIVVAVPFGAATPAPATNPDAATHYAESSLANTASAWHSRIDRVELSLPTPDSALVQTLSAMQAYILINQDGPAIQPGSRSYERSWIRDGALTSEALLRTGHANRVRAFIEWYAPFQYANGKVPCCVDRRGADPVPEHDSDGEFIYLVRQYYRFTHDSALLIRMWPHVQRAVAYLDSLRNTERTAAYRTPELQEFYGILPPSISHEGYSAKPMHSYWDDFWALRGFEDATALARTLDHPDSARRYRAITGEFRGDLLTSIEASMQQHHIDFIPGSADLGDFDATSTTIALEPGDNLGVLPRDAVAHTFDRYWRESQARASGSERERWDAYTPYELRTVGSFVRLGEPERAHDLLNFLMRGQRPAGWHEWAEVVGRDPRKPRFIGDMPHTWVGSDFIRSLLDFFVYDSERDSTLVVNAGVPESWARVPGGISVRGIHTPYGVLDMSERESGGTAVVTISGPLHVPSGGLRVHAPFPRRPKTASVNGVLVPIESDRSVVLRVVPAKVSFRY